MRKQYALALVASVIAVSMVLFALSPYEVSVLNGDSMQPHADSCDIMLIDGSQDSMQDFERGDWVRYESHNRHATVIHRVVAHGSNNIYSDGPNPTVIATHPVLITKGINNPSYDEPVSEEQIRGKVIGHLPTPDCGA